MQNDKQRCGLSLDNNEKYSDRVTINAYIWREDDWKHDEQQHSHARGQLSFIEEGYQYFHVNEQIYLVPQDYAIWIPAETSHKITSNAEKIRLSVLLALKTKEHIFFKKIQIFKAPSLLKSMLHYASKWNQQIDHNEEQETFLKAILDCLPTFHTSNVLQIAIPSDDRLVKVCHHIFKNYHQDLKIEEYAVEGNMSVRTLQRVFKEATGMTVQKYIQINRILKSVEILSTSKLTLSQVAFHVGYKSLSAFTASYKDIMKSLPCNSKI